MEVLFQRESKESKAKWRGYILQSRAHSTILTTTPQSISALSLGTAASEGIAQWRCLISGQPWPLAPCVSQQRWEVVMGVNRKAKM